MPPELPPVVLPRRRERLLVGGVFLLLAVLLLWPVVRHPAAWIWKPGSQFSDLAVTHWPNAHFTRRALWEQGRFPLWRPTIMGGSPFAANPLAGLYYPLNWPLLFLPWLPLALGFNLSALLHLCLAGITMYALMRRGFGLGLWGSLVAGVIYAASPKLVAHLAAGHVGWSQAWAWLPLALLCWWRVVRAEVRAGRWAAATGAVLAVQFCADVRMAAYTLIALAALALAGGFERRAQPLGRYLAHIALAGAVFLGLAACQWVPMLALLPETTRSAMTLHDVMEHSLPWSYLLGLLLADHGGFHEWMTYLGVTSLVLAGLGLRRLWRGRWGPWLAVWLLGVIWFCLGENGGLFPLLWRVVPGLGLLRVPPRAWVLVVVTVAGLAGVGMESAPSLGRWGRMLAFAAGAFPLALVLLYTLLFGVPPLSLALLGLLAPLSLGITAARLHARRPWLRGATVALLALDLLLVDGTLLAARAPSDVFAEGREVAAWLAAQPAAWPGAFRIYSPSYSLPQHVAERYGLHLADGVDPVQLRVYADLLTRAAGLEPQGYSVTLPPFPPEAEDVRTALRGVEPETALLRRLGVRYVAAAFPMTVPGWREVVVFDGVHVYEIGTAPALPEPTGAGELVLADGSVLFDYQPWPVYLGWVLSLLTLLAWIGLTLRSTDV